MSTQTAASRGLIPLGKIVAMAQAGVEPRIMGTGPIPAVELVVSIYYFHSEKCAPK